MKEIKPSVKFLVLITAIVILSFCKSFGKYVKNSESLVLQFSDFSEKSIPLLENKLILLGAKEISLCKKYSLIIFKYDPDIYNTQFYVNELQKIVPGTLILEKVVTDMEQLNNDCGL